MVRPVHHVSTSHVLPATWPVQSVLQYKYPLGAQQVQNMICYSGFRHHVDWLVEANISQKHAVPIFSTEVMSNQTKGLHSFRSQMRGFSRWHREMCLSVPSREFCSGGKQDEPGPSYTGTGHQYSGQEDETYGPDLKGSNRDWALSQHEQRRQLFSESDMEASYLWL
jgi:hypothetical protein